MLPCKIPLVFSLPIMSFLFSCPLLCYLCIAASEAATIGPDNRFSRPTDSGELEAATTSTLKEVLHGPLARDRISLLLAVDVHEALDVNKVLSGLGRDVRVLQPSSVVPESFKYDNDAEGNEDSEDLFTLMTIDVLVVLVWRAVPGTLFDPPGTWRIRSLLLISLDFDCEARMLLKAPLAARTPSVALFCPSRAAADIVDLKNQPGNRENRRNNDAKEERTVENGSRVVPIASEPENGQNRRDKDTNKDTTVENGNRVMPVVSEEPAILFYVLTWLPFHASRRLHRLGYWNPLAFQSFKAIFPSRFRSMGGRTIRVASDDDDIPLFYKDGEGGYGGTCKHILESLSTWMNFTYTLTSGAPDLKWGELDNGTWVGLLGEVYKGHKDLAINYFTITHQRAQYFDYSVSYLNEGFGFALPVPPELPRWRNLVYPFTWVVWASVGGLLVFTCCAYFVLLSLQSQPLALSARVANALVSIMKGLVNQPQSQPPHTWSLRVFLALWWVTAYILVISYTGNLIAVLTIPVYPSRINTLDQLAESQYRLCMLDYGEFVPEALATSSDKVMRTLGGKMDFVPVTDEGYYGQEDCARLVLDRTNAHIETLAYLEITYADMGLSDSVYFMKEQIYEGNLAFFYRRHTPWKPVFDEGMRRLIEAGFVPKWQRDIMLKFRQTPGQSASQDSSLEPLTLAHLQGAFLVFLLGLSTSFSVFLMEYKC